MKEEMNLIPLTFEKAITLKHGDYVYTTNATARTKAKWKVTGKVKLWKRTPGRFSIPIKYGWYFHNYINQRNLPLFEIEKSEN